MSSKMTVVIASAEAVPYAKVGGLADVIGALAKLLPEKNIDLRIALPLYRQVRDKGLPMQPVDVPPAIIKTRTAEFTCRLWTGPVPDSDARAWFIEENSLFDRPGIYTDPATGRAWPDDHLRFIVYQRALVHFLGGVEPVPDLVHCNDSHTALIPAYLRLLTPPESPLNRTATLLSIHNLGYQGIFPPETFADTGFPGSLFYPLSPFEFWGKLNFMKTGLVYADLLNTVSPTYAKEIQSADEYGFGLQGVLSDRKDDLSGILNGVDYGIWNPATDSLIPANYDMDTLDNKRRCKEALLDYFGLESTDPDRPCLGVVSRLADQKGFDILAEVMEDVLREGVYFILLGSGEPKYVELFKSLAEKWPDQVGVSFTFDDKLAHWIEAGADMFLMPSRYEPCGLNQLYSLKYGTIPIVRKTGGLADSIVPYDMEKRVGTGFAFEAYTSKALLEAIRQALSVYRERFLWNRLVKQAMEKDFSWTRSTEGYISLYSAAIRRRAC